MNDTNQIFQKINDLYSITSSEWIAVISVILALGSAIFAYRSWLESKKANRISIHPIQIEIYDAFNDLHINFCTKKIFTDTKKSAGFYKLSEKAEFYFDETISKLLREYFDIYRELFILQVRYNKNIDDEIRKAVFEDVDKLLNKEELLYSQIKENFRTVLKISGLKQ